MSGRFPEERLSNGSAGPQSTPDSTLSCSLCHAPLSQDARVLPNCLHSFCRYAVYSILRKSSNPWKNYIFVHFYILSWRQV